MKDSIIHHEDWQKQGFLAFINTFLRKKGLPLAPPLSEVKGKVAAKINQGRWVVECLTEGCGGAVVVSRVPLFFCPECANEGNEGKWLTVDFPKNKAEIEKELLKRSAKDPFRAMHRNWIPGETVAKLQAENKLHPLFIKKEDYN